MKYYEVAEITLNLNSKGYEMGDAVSYTHLDVYKRQILPSAMKNGCSVPLVRKKENLSDFWLRFYGNTKPRVTIWRMPYGTMKNTGRAGHRKRKRPYRC